MLPKIESPFSNEELQAAFDSQSKKEAFQLIKSVVTDKNKKTVVEYTIKGNKISNQFGIWKDDYIIHLDYAICKYEGGGYAVNRFESFEDFKKEIFKAFNLTEQTQMSLF